MVFGVAMNFFGMFWVAPWVFLPGAMAFSAMQARQRYTGRSFVIRRLRRMMLAADVLFVVAALMLLENNYGFLLPLFTSFGVSGVAGYYQYVAHNNWVVVLLIAAVIELYTTHRISGELAKGDDATQ